MLYDGAIRFLKEAVAELANGNIPAKVQLLDKVEKIIDYLESCLDREHGGEIASNLEKLYDYMLVRLTEANLYNDRVKLEEVGRLLGTVREGWAAVCEGARKERESREPQQEEEGSTPKKIVVSV